MEQGTSKLRGTIPFPDFKSIHMYMIVKHEKHFLNYDQTVKNISQIGKMILSMVMFV
jgi:hypothetical protein